MAHSWEVWSYHSDLWAELRTSNKHIVLFEYGELSWLCLNNSLHSCLTFDRLGMCHRVSPVIPLSQSLPVDSDQEQWGCSTFLQLEHLLITSKLTSVLHISRSYQYWWYLLNELSMWIPHYKKNVPQFMDRLVRPPVNIRDDLCLTYTIVNSFTLTEVALWILCGSWEQPHVPRRVQLSMFKNEIEYTGQRWPAWIQGFQ